MHAIMYIYTYTVAILVKKGAQKGAQKGLTPEEMDLSWCEENPPITPVKKGSAVKITPVKKTQRKKWKKGLRQKLKSHQ